MIRIVLLAIVATCLASPGEYDLPFVPRVMFWCGKVNQHIDLSTGEWTTDADGVSGCIPLENKAAILDYCRKVYPSQRVTNVVETNSYGEGSHWCERGNVNCVYEGRKPAFQCVVGRFESRALNVPDSCRFAHHYEHSACLEHDSLHAIATEECGTELLFDYGMIIDCGLDKFRGVEYVCCPEAGTSKPEPEPEVEPVKPEVEPVEPEVKPVKPEVEPVEPEVEPEVKTIATEKTKEEAEIEEILATIPSLVDDGDVTVDTLAHTLDLQHHCNQKMLHSLYMDQRDRMDGSARGRMGLILRQYHRALAAAGELKLRDGETAEKMLGTIKMKFRKLVVDSERMAATDRRKLKGVHGDDLKECYQERICKGLQMFKMVLAEKPTEARRILLGVNGALEKELDEHRVAATAPRQPGHKPERERHHTLERINKQITFARDFLAAATKAVNGGTLTFPYTDFDCPLGEEKKPEATEVTTKFEEAEPEPEASQSGESESGERDEDETQLPVIDFPMEPGPVILPGPVLPVEETEAVPTETKREEITDVLVNEVIKDEHSIEIETNKAVDRGQEWIPKPEGLARSRVNTDDVVLSDQKSSSSSGSFLGVAIGLAVGAAVMIGTIVIIIAVHRRKQGGSYEVGIVGEEEAAKKEENSLQECGYENPAYKFFEEMEDDEEGLM